MKFILTLIVALCSFNLFAADGSSGCGPGWYILKENSILSSSLRVTTNGLLFPTTTIGMTIGSSNCSRHKLVLTEKESLHYAVNNFYELKSEIAQGNGEFLSAFADTIGCKQETQKLFNQELKKKYKTIFNSNKAEESLKEVYKIILENQDLTYSCSLS